MWEMEEGGDEEENSLSEYFINNYHRYFTCHPFYFQQQFLGTGATQGVQRTRLVSGASDSAKTQTWSSSGENVFHQMWLKGTEPFWN